MNPYTPQDLPLTGGHSTDTPTSNIPPEAMPAKKPRQPGRQWLRFYQFDRREYFELHGKMAMRENFCLASVTKAPPRMIFVAPWKKVHSYRPVKGTKRNVKK